MERPLVQKASAASIGMQADRNRMSAVGGECCSLAACQQQSRASRLGLGRRERCKGSERCCVRVEGLEKPLAVTASHADVDSRAWPFRKGHRCNQREAFIPLQSRIPCQCKGSCCSKADANACEASGADVYRDHIRHALVGKGCNHGDQTFSMTATKQRVFTSHKYAILDQRD